MTGWSADRASLRRCITTAKLNNIMRVAKYLSAPALSLVLVVGLLGSQICAFNCSLYGCSVPSPVQTSANSSEHSHCHQRQKTTAPQKHNGSPQCAGHFDAVALASSRSSAYKSYQIPSADSLIIQTSPSFIKLPERQMVQSTGKPDRSPPSYSVLRI